MSTPAARNKRSTRSDGPLIAGIALLLYIVTTIWLATGIAGLLQHGHWPHIRFAHTGRAIRRLFADPSDIDAAWRQDARVSDLPSPTMFWITVALLTLVFLTATTYLLITWSKVRRAKVSPAREGATQAAAAQPPKAGPAAAPPRPTTVQPPALAPQAGHTTGGPKAAGAASGGTPSPASTAPFTMPAPSTSASPVTTPSPAADAAEEPYLLSADALSIRARSIRPELPLLAGAPHHTHAYGIHLGIAQLDGTELYGGLDQTVCVFGPPGSGKTSRLIHQAIVSAPGPVLVTCEGPHTVERTLSARQKIGPVLVFDPLQLTDSAHRLRWSPVQGCEDPNIADSRARALLEPVRPLARTLLSDNHTWRLAQTLLRCWLHAAALDRRPFRQVQRWSTGQSTSGAVKILRTAKDAAADWAGALESSLCGHQQQLPSARTLTMEALASISQLHILNSCTPSGSERFQVESFLHERGTLYVVGEGAEDPRAHPTVVPLLTALTSNVVEHGRRMAAASSSGRLDPPLLAALDDIATLAPLPTLPELISVGARTGIPTLAVFRSEEQARHRWGERGSATIRQTADIRLTMESPGLAKIYTHGQHPVTSQLPAPY